MIRQALLPALLAFTFPAYAQTITGPLADEQSIGELIAQLASSAQKDDVDGMVATQHDGVGERLDDG